jgi:hypothetical protein
MIAIVFALAADHAPLDSVAAVVERSVITVSEVQSEARLVLLEKAGVDSARGRVDEELAQAVLDNIVAQELLALEARRTGVAVRESDIDKSIAATRALFANPDDARAFLVHYGIDEELLRARARRDLAAQALLERMFADVRVSDDEADAFLSEHKDLADRDTARIALVQKKKSERFDALMHKLKGEVEVRIIGR